jgi:hypothetical protein
VSTTFPEFTPPAVLPGGTPGAYDGSLRESYNTTLITPSAEATSGNH